MFIVSRRTLLQASPFLVAAAVASPLTVLASAKKLEKVRYHAAKLAEALSQVNPGSWVVDICPDYRFALIHRRPHA